MFSGNLHSPIYVDVSARIGLVCRALTLSCYHFRQFLYQGTVPVRELSTTDQDRNKANWAGHRRGTVHPTLMSLTVVEYAARKACPSRFWYLSMISGVITYNIDGEIITISRH
jgi:hypothetical protein